MADGVAVMVALQLAYGPVQAIVANRVYAGDIPADATLPALGVKEISRVDLGTVSGNEANTLITARIQVTVAAKTYPDQKALLLATKLGAGTHTGTIASTQVRSVIRDAVGPDLSDVSARIYSQSRDFKVTYLEPNPA
jgi:hypothetical protein